MSEIQVHPKHYNGLSYDTKKRFISYWHQLEAIYKTNYKKVLEIGVGNGFVSNYLDEHGFDISTLDIDERLEPTKVGSVLDIPFDDNKFEVVTCFEVLEHLPFEQVPVAVKELKRVASQKVIISLPDRTLCYKLGIKLPIIKDRKWMISIPRLLAKKHTFDGQHHWELGKKSYPVSRFKNLLEQHGLNIESFYRIYEVPSHHFFVLSL